jgi:hypothetical protein
MSNLKDSDNGVQYSESMGLWMFSVVRNSGLFPSSGEGRETRTLLGPLDGPNLIHLTNFVELS